MEIEPLLKQISTDLFLEYESKDWGIINSCSDRVEEFINYFNKNNEFPTNIQFELFELIVASFNDLILEHKEDNTTTNLFVNFVVSNSRKPFLDIIDYWKGIYNEEEFPVAKYFPVIK